MCALRRSAFWPRVVAISLIGLSAASCTDSGRFFGSTSAQHSGDTTGSISQAPSGHVESRPLPHLAGADAQGSSGGGQGMGSYQAGEVTGSVPAAPPAWTWEGGTPITVGPADTLESIARRHSVPASAIMTANHMSSAVVHPGEHLVIPRRSPGAIPPATRIAARPPVAPVGAPRTVLTPTSGVHVVAPGETLHSIARLYGKPVMMLAKANNVRPDTMVKVGERIIVPDVHPGTTASIPRTQAHATVQDVAAIDSPQSARVATPEAPVQESSVKTAEPAGNLPGFRWPVRGRVIAGFGPTPNGLQNDGINLAVPEGTPVKAAEDGVVAYAGSELKGYGNLVLVRHANGFVTAYAHASDILVKRGEMVKRGQVIAHSGQTGNVSSPQLHFEIRKGATPVDPSQYLNGA